MGMIFAGMTEGLGNGITAIAHNEAAMDAALAKLNAQKDVSDMHKQAAMYASDSRLRGVEDRISTVAANAGKGGSGDPDIQSPERARMLAAMDLNINGAQAQQMEDYATTGKAPMVTQYQQLVQQKDAFDADPSAQGTAADGSSVDYSDATTRRLQQQSTTQTTVTKDVIDPAFADMYASKSQAAANSYRKSFQPKEYKSMAEGDSEKQQQGLINNVALGGPNAINAGKAVTLANGDPIYNNSGVNTVDGSGTSYSRSQEKTNSAQTKASADMLAPKPTTEVVKNQAKAPSVSYKMKIDQAMSQYGFTDADLPPLSTKALPNGDVIARSPIGDEVTIFTPIPGASQPPLRSSKPEDPVSRISPEVAAMRDKQIASMNARFNQSRRQQIFEANAKMVNENFPSKLAALKPGMNRTDLLNLLTWFDEHELSNDQLKQLRTTREHLNI